MLAYVGVQKLIQALWRASWHYLILSNEPISYAPAIPVLGIHSSENHMQVHKESDTRICAFEVLFALAKSWSNPDVYHWSNGEVNYKGKHITNTANQ